MKIKNKIVLLMTSILLFGCEVTTEEEQEKKEVQTLHVEEKETKKEIKNLPKDLVLIKEDKKNKIYKDSGDKIYLIENDYYYEGQDAMAIIEKNRMLDYKDEIEIIKNINHYLSVNNEFIFVENEEEKERVYVEKKENEYVIKSKKTEISVKENIEKEELKKEEENIEGEMNKEEWEKEAISIIKNIRKTYYENEKWINEVQEMINYANDRWGIVREGEELVVEIDGDEYIEIKEKMISDELKETLKKNKITIIQYKDKEAYELTYIIHDEKKNKESKKIIIKEKEEEILPNG